MTSLDLYKFVLSNKLEYHWYVRGERSNFKEDVVLFVSAHLIESFTNLLGDSILEEEGLECVLKKSYICIWMEDIVSYFDIKLEDIFEKRGQLSHC